MKNTFKLTAVAMLVVATTGCNLFDTRTVYRDPDDSKLRQLNEQIQQAQTNLDKLKAEQQQAQKNLTAAKAALSQAQADKVAADKMLQAAKTATEKAQAEKLVAEKAAQVANAAKVKAEAEKVAAEKAAQEAKALADKAAADAKAAADKAKNSQSAQDKAAAAEKAKAEQEATKKAAEAKKRAEELAKKNAEVEKKRLDTKAYREALEGKTAPKWRISYEKNRENVNFKGRSDFYIDGNGTRFDNVEFYDYQPESRKKNNNEPVLKNGRLDFSTYEINPNKVQTLADSDNPDPKNLKVVFVNLRNATLMSTDNYSEPVDNQGNRKPYIGSYYYSTRLAGVHLEESDSISNDVRASSNYLSAKPTATYTGKVLGEYATAWGNLKLVADFKTDKVSGQLIKADKSATYDLVETDIKTNGNSSEFLGKVITDKRFVDKIGSGEQGKYQGSFLGENAEEVVGSAKFTDYRYDKDGVAQNYKQTKVLFGGSREPASNFPIAGEKTNYK